MLDLKPLDFVKTPGGGIAIVKETHDFIYIDGKPHHKEASLTYIYDPSHERTAWWDERELAILTSLPRILADTMRHPFGDGYKDAKAAFPIINEL